MRPDRRVRLVGLAAIVVGLGVMTAAPVSAASVVSVPASIDASGGRDVTAALNAFFAKVPAFATVTFPSSGRYRLEGVLRLTHLVDVTIEGNGATLFAQTDGQGSVPPSKRYRAHWPRLREQISVRGANGLALKDLEVQGPNSKGENVAALEGQAGIAVYASRGVSIQGVTVSRTYGDGVYIAGSTTNVVVRDSTFATIGRQGVAAVDATNIVIERNQFRAIARSVVDLEPASRRWSVAGVHVQDNDIGDFQNFLLAAGGSGPNVSDVWLERNHVTAGNGLAVFAGMPRWPRQGLHIDSNTSDVPGRQVADSGRTGVMQISNIDGVDIIGNHQPVEPGTAAVVLAAVCNLTFRDNVFPGAAADRKTTAACGAAIPRRGPSGAGAKKSAGKPATGTAPARARSKPGATNSGWLIAGAVAGAVMLVILGGLRLWARRRSPA